MNQKLIKGGHTSHLPLHTSNRGITLIALVITIIVLLILAGVTINMVLGEDGIIQNAQKAKEATKEAEEQEKDNIQELELQLAKNAGKTNASTVDEYALEKKYSIKKEEYQNAKNDTTNEEIKNILNFEEYVLNEVCEGVQLGDVVNYEEPEKLGYDGQWRLLGTEDGKILLISDIIGDKTLEGADGYLNGEKYLNEMCAPYANRQVAEYARSINEDDIFELADEIKGRDIVTGDIANKGSNLEYGNTVTYICNEDGTISTESTNGTKTENIGFTNFRKVEDGSLLKPGERYTAQNARYGFKLNCNNKYEIGEVRNDTFIAKIVSLKTIEMMLCAANTAEYWVASKSIFAQSYESDTTNPATCSWGLMSVSAEIYNNTNKIMWLRRKDYLYNSCKHIVNGQSISTDGGSNIVTRGVRAVVCLNENATLERAADGITFDIKINS